MGPRKIFALLKQTLDEWLDDRGFTRSASLSYYTVFSIAPLLLIAVAVAGFVFGNDAVTGQLHEELQGMVGDEGATAVQVLLELPAIVVVTQRRQPEPHVADHQEGDTDVLDGP